jgi:periplasmic divalent cation tolerance protein
MPALVVLSTFPDLEQAKTIARTLVEERLAACVNVQGASGDSIYRWQGTIEQERETLAIVKTTSERLDALIARLVELHPYKVPEVIALPIVGGYAPYLQWLEETTGSP